MRYGFDLTRWAGDDLRGCLWFALAAPVFAFLIGFAAGWVFRG